MVASTRCGNAEEYMLERAVEALERAPPGGAHAKTPSFGIAVRL